MTITSINKNKTLSVWGSIIGLAIMLGLAIFIIAKKVKPE